MKKFNISTLSLLLLASVLVAADTHELDSLVVSFSNPSQAGTVKAEMMMGDITVRTHSGKDVIIVTKENPDMPRNAFVLPEMAFDAQLFFTNDKKADKEPDPEKIKGLKKIQSSQFGINVEENNNIIEITMPPMFFLGQGGNELDLIVPKRTSLQLKSVQGAINVNNVIGDIEVEATGGDIDLNNVGGTIVAHTMRNIDATVTHVAPDKPMSFSTYSGDIDVTLPTNMNATLKLKSHGDIYTDFDTSKRRMAKSVSEDRDSEVYKATVEKLLEIPVNGGGQDIEFTNFSGTIYIRKNK
ncbi:hypothetical protein EH223_06075 [candidate division KSB1 bacterium]|nr:DUF4097 family beta strand repeat protein [candidate division KSB1 bacterium]RQW05006.1 MAG: hypothetical protein EH223_06075 [candidate division KSB1 bacterium]